MNGARKQILKRVRTALRGASPAAPAEPFRGGAGQAEPEALVGLLRGRLEDYKADGRRVDADEVGRAVERVCREREVQRLVIPFGVPPDWKPAGVELLDDTGLSPHELDALDGVVTGCTVAVAETGTIVLAAGPGEGRRALTLVPDLHVCVVLESQIVADVPAAMELLAPLVREQRRPLTLISGPSATSDIELQRVEGVHGPRQMVVLIVAD